MKLWTWYEGQLGLTVTLDRGYLVMIDFECPSLTRSGSEHLFIFCCPTVRALRSRL
jgi:hypothetical protein